MKCAGKLKSFDELIDILKTSNLTYPIVFIQFLCKNAGKTLNIEKSEIGGLWYSDGWILKTEYFEEVITIEN